MVLGLPVVTRSEELLRALQKAKSINMTKIVIEGRQTFKILLVTAVLWLF